MSLVCITLLFLSLHDVGLKCLLQILSRYAFWLLFLAFALLIFLFFIGHQDHRVCDPIVFSPQWFRWFLWSVHLGVSFKYHPWRLGLSLSGSAFIHFRPRAHFILFNISSLNLLYLMLVNRRQDIARRSVQTRWLLIWRLLFIIGCWRSPFLLHLK